ncbi:MAG: hypothetical protein GX417_11295 [Clostridiales bacterium]|nr:hypothetical protein [Clostridiales bacterium]
MQNGKQGILSGAAASAVFLALLFFAKAGLIVSVLAGLASYLLFAFLIFRKRTVRIVAEGVTQEDVEEALAEGDEKVKSLETSLSGIQDEAVARPVRQIVTVARAIYSDIRKEPKNIKQARKFITYYMDTAGYIVSRYVAINQDKNYVENGDELVKKIAATLENLSAAFVKMKSRLMENDLFELETEIKLLEQTIKSEGF